MDINNFKKLTLQYHEENGNGENTELLIIHFKRLAEAEKNIWERLEAGGDIPAHKMEEARAETHKELFAGIEHLIEVYAPIQENKANA